MLKKRIASFGYAFRGIADLFGSEVNARIHAVAAILALGLGWYLDISRVEWGLIALCIAAVLSAEAFNTSLEALTDLVSPERQELARKAKDTAAGAVLLVAMGAATVGLLIFLPKLLRIWGL
ncbi:MAG: diacylglycerol kinase family protein [Bacteroidota bacterium]